MNLNEAKDKFYELADEFFAGAEVRWAESISTKPHLPYLTMKAGPLRRTSFPREDDDGNMVYDCTSTIEVNLYTKGSPVNPANVAGNVTGNFENTALSDLNDFGCFIESEIIVDRIAGWGMDISLKEGTVKDLTELLNDTAHRYRSFAEFTVNFAQAANGPYGISTMPVVPNSSGGGSSEMKNADALPIESVEISETNSDNE